MEHSARHVVCVEHVQNPSHSRVESLEETRVDEVGVEGRHFDSTLFPFELLTERLEVACEGELASRIVRVALASHVSGDGADVDEVELVLVRVRLNLGLSQKEHAQVHVGDKVHIHHQLYQIYRGLRDSLSQADSCVVDQNMNRSMVFDNLGPQLFNVVTVRQVALVKVNVFEVCVAALLPDEGKHFFSKVLGDVDHDHIDRSVFNLGCKLARY